MNKSNKLKVIALIFLILCTITIVIFCALFVNNENNKKGNSDNSKGTLKFSYSNSLTIAFGDSFDFSPINSNVILLYSTGDPDVLTISQEGVCKTKKCGKVQITIRDGSKVVKSVSVKIIAKYKFEDFVNCSFENDILFLTSTSAQFKFYIIKSNGDVVSFENEMDISSSSGIVAYSNFGFIWIDATSDGSFNINYEDFNINLTFEVDLNNE